MFLIKRNGIYYLDIKDELSNKRIRVSTKTRNKTAAISFLRNFNLEQIQNSGNKHITLAQFRDEYIKYCEAIHTESYLKRSIIPAFKKLIIHCGEIEISRITFRITDQFVSSVFIDSHSAASLYYRTLKAAFTKAIAWGYINDNPFKKIKLPRQVKSYPAFISLDELHRITDVTGVKLLRDIFTTAFFTGMRLGEIVNMKWDWIDLNSNVLVIRNDSGFCTKSKKERTIPIHNEVKEILTTYQKNLTSQYVFTVKPGIKICPDYISRNFKKSVKMIGLNNNIHFHSLRHSFASRLAQKGVSLYVVKELLGHESLSTTQIYSHLIHENLTLAINSI